jgi:hypothetical protein
MNMVEGCSDWEEITNGCPNCAYRGNNEKHACDSVVEKDWEVDSLVLDKQIFVYRNADGTFSPPDARLIETGVTFSLDGLIEANYSIHSVRRLSDNEVFTVGDTVLHKNNVTKRWDKIEYFHIMSNGIWVKTDEYDVPLSYIHSKVDEAPRKPLFVTEDKIEVYEGDSFYILNKARLKLLHHNMEDFKFKANKGTPTPSDFELYFSNLDAANDYILLNSKCLSVRDVIKKYPYFDILMLISKSNLPKEKCVASAKIIVDEFAIILKQLAKSKLNGRNN